MKLLSMQQLVTDMKGTVLSIEQLYRSSHSLPTSNMNNTILHLMYIMFLCDCLRHHEAEKHLVANISCFPTSLSHQVAEAKVLLTKALTHNAHNMLVQSKSILLNTPTTSKDPNDTPIMCMYS